ncbi:MAG TPA: Wzz/FepE/Etk N-terminal domain-containing protein, partial [Isosphaeraceae bacterium]|nr:Wzz/FepE/Etk N-terminal domain-containing protein [Isosphaeraceae bacterium]
MDGIQPYPGQPGTLHLRQPAWQHHWAPLKSASDYFRALRRRCWLVALVAILVGVAGTLWVLRLPPVYRVSAQVLIEPPQFDLHLAGIVANDGGRPDPQATAQYIPNRLAHLRSRAMANEVVGDSRVAQSFDPGVGDPAGDLLSKLSTRQLLPNTGYYDVFLEGNDPERTTRLLNTLLDRFEKDAANENVKLLEVSRTHAQHILDSLQKELAHLDEKVNNLLQGSPIFAPGGRNILLDHYAAMTTLYQQNRMRHNDLINQHKLSQVWPNLNGAPPRSPREAELNELKKWKRKYLDYANYLRGMVKPGKFDRDPAAKNVAMKLAGIMEEMQQLEAGAEEPMPDRAAIAVNRSEEDLENLGKEVQDLLKRLQESMPKYQEYTTLLSSREQTVQRIFEVQTRLESFGFLADANASKYPVRVMQRADEPTVPVRPNRPLLIALVCILGLFLGGALVGLLEHLDHSVKAPEQLAMGLSLPLFGVIPRIRRTARLDRGGHLCTAGSPGSLEADAYRNLRASLLGASGPRGLVVTLLVTSAKAGEGKSTTALNLAATCARAGERTLLMDVDLRRPSLADVFDGVNNRLGLVDILRGDVPWQRALVRTDIENLDFLPTGDTFDVPIEVLGTRELRQLVSALA